MKKGRNIILPLLLLSLLVGNAPSAAAETLLPDVNLTEGKIMYSTAAGVYLTATDTDYDVRGDGSRTPYYGISVPVNVEGESFSLDVTNENGFSQSFSLVLVTEQGRYATENFSVAPGKNKVLVSLSDAKGFTGKLTGVEIVCDAFYYLNGVLIFEGISEASGESVWVPAEDNWTKIENEAVTATYRYTAANILTGGGLEAEKWYPVTFSSGNTDLSAYAGFSFYVDTTLEGKEVYFNKYVQEVQGSVFGEQWYTPDEGVYYCYPDSGSPFTMTGNIVPSYFKGRIEVAFASFLKPDWTNAGNDVFDLDQTDGTVGFTFDGNRGDFSMGLKDFRLLTEVEKIVAEVKTQGDIRFLDEMSGYDSTQAARYAWRTNWSLASPCEVQLIENPAPTAGANGNALKITPLDAPKNPLPDPTTGSTVPTGYTALELFPVGGAFDISGSRGITFFIANAEAAPFYLNVEFDILQDGLRQRWGIKQYGRYLLYDTERDTQKLYNAFNGIYIPADFCGWVRVDYSQIKNPSWESVGGEFTSDTELVYFVINVDTAQFSGHSFVFDSLGVYARETQLNTLFHDSQDDVKNAIGGMQ